MAKESKGKSKTDVTSRDKSGRITNRDCSHCGARLLNDREMVVVMDDRRRNKSYYQRDCFNRMLGSDLALGSDGNHRCPLGK
jgi:hypothetical protein